MGIRFRLESQPGERGPRVLELHMQLNAQYILSTFLLSSTFRLSCITIRLSCVDVDHLSIIYTPFYYTSSLHLGVSAISWLGPSAPTSSVFSSCLMNAFVLSTTLLTISFSLLFTTYPWASHIPAPMVFYPFLHSGAF